ncbi:HD domain-containing protein [Clostridium bornimense]|uniref:HD domain-containing protein n=1 Tax=Clostridium bornimense TaxID=1216932 RepID=UPI001C10DA72|nr:HD domain-containing protein [Clostridium bornimense]MBU5316873.1 HD domain-containing protein [Clostridium bornimense]
MERVTKIISNELYKKSQLAIENLEKERKFCNHDFNHYIDTARIAYIISLEEGYNVDKEIIYATALLHDIGRVDEYTLGISHDIASAEKAKIILKQCFFEDNEIEIIYEAIKDHRGYKNIKSKEKEMTLSELLYRADKLSRCCYNCDAYLECKWDDEIKNNNIKY